ncbi:MAG TPA: (Fe-S)-binding protein [Dehalococcoidales bacterium]
MSEEMLARYEYELAEPPCAPGSGRYGVRIILSEDISPVFPYLNTVLEDTYYDHENKVLIGRDEQRQYAFRDMDIRVAGVNEVTEAPEIARKAVILVNRVWHERTTIKPSYTERKLPTTIDIYRYLPKTNCRQCSYATCLVFASELRIGKCMLEQCLPLSQPENKEKKEALKKLFDAG